MQTMIQRQFSHRSFLVPILIGTLITLSLAEEQAPEVAVTTGDLRLVARPTANGLRLESVQDTRYQWEFLATNSLPLFQMVLKQVESKRSVSLAADLGWLKSSARQDQGEVFLLWDQPADQELQGIQVRATVRGDGESHALRWRFQVTNTNARWTVERVTFPQIALRNLGSEAAAFFPRGPGEVQPNLWTRKFRYHGQYPSGWCSMQFLALYREGINPTGLYLGLHDPWGSTKDIEVESDPATASVAARFVHPAPDLGKRGNAFVLSGEAVWQLLRGNWYDAAQVYRSWVRQEARWWPKLTADGRSDTPKWMRELSAWVMTGGAPEECVPRVLQFQRWLGLPVGFHWYNWHQIPFDNDYPHYFPAKPDFARGVSELQQNQVFVMPYINGRLWDSHDRGAEDFEFTRLALAAATKQENGQPFLESYGSKETNGQPVRLAAMCPTTELWQRTVRDIVLQLFREQGTRSVYIDQVAAAAPTLCVDPAHGHPLGGGHWWNEGYWNLLRDLRREMPSECMITTECNAEPFLHCFDGYLTWHWQYDGQVPAFPAVYGGAIQMFGRAYRGGATKDLALRMKAGQQWVFGEQIGWFDPGVMAEPKNADFLRRLIHLRWQLRPYFYRGEMARPPALSGDRPQVKADWQWSGEWWVTTDAVLTGAWQIPADKRLVLLFVNVSENPVKTALAFEPSRYGITANPWQRVVRAGAPGEPIRETFSGHRRCEFELEAGEAQAWEITW